MTFCSYIFKLYSLHYAVCLPVGLDPAEPYFQGTDAFMRLDTSDATFVDVIHTDGLPFDPKLGANNHIYMYVDVF